MQSANKRILKNSILLYVRMFVQMGISLYTSRIILQALGVTDFGLYNVVGGVITMFTFISASVTSTIQRFLTCEIGRSDIRKINSVLSVSLFVFFIISIAILLLAETIGLWFVNTKLVVPLDRLGAVAWIYQTTIAICVVSLFTQTFSALVIAYERMDVFSYISIFESVARLGVALLISYTVLDKLILYGNLLLLVSIVSLILYVLYIRIKLNHIKFNLWSTDKLLLRQMWSFACWNLLGGIAFVCETQGVNVLLNLFFGPLINAARAIAVQVEGVARNFVNNFQTAMNPQIMKSSAVDDYERQFNLINYSSKYSFYLTLLIILPLTLNIDGVLDLWLVEYPECTPYFIQLSLATVLMSSLATPLIIAILAIGNIRNYQIWVGGLTISIIIFDYIVLKIGGQPHVVYYCSIIMMSVCQLLRLRFYHKLSGYGYDEYMKCVVLPISIVLLMSVAFPLLLDVKDGTTIMEILVNSIISDTIVVLSILLFGLNKFERQILKEKAKVLIVK